GYRIIGTALPPRVAIVEYAQLDDRLIIWVVQPNSLHMAVAPASRESTAERVRSLYTALSAGDRPSIEQSLVSLHGLLIRPIATLLAPGSTLVVVPDDTVSAVPFSALRNSETGHLLVQDSAITVVPSATLYLQACSRNREWRGVS